MPVAIVPTATEATITLDTEAVIPTLTAAAANIGAATTETAQVAVLYLNIQIESGSIVIRYCYRITS